MPSWEEMCQQIVVAGRPGDVTSAALGWEQLLKNLNSVKESLDKNVTDLGEVWKGPAYDSFKTHVKQIATDTGRVVDDAEKHNGIVQSLKTAADKLSAAQADFPIPASCVNDVLEARNGRLVIDTGLFEMKVKPDFLGLLDPLTSLADWINDKSEEAAKVYTQVSGDYVTIDSGTPGDVRPAIDDRSPDVDTPNLDKPGSVNPNIGNPNVGNPNVGNPNVGNPNVGNPNIDKFSPGKPDLGMPDTKTPDIGSGAHPDLSGGYQPDTDSLADDYGSGLAGAGAPTVPALGGGGGGMPSTSGLGAGGGLGSGGGLGGGGVIPGGGSLGRPVSPNMGPMMGGGAAGAGRNGGRGGGKLGAGGMAPMMGGAAGGGGRGGGRAGAAGAGAKGVGAGARGFGGMAGAGGAGYGEEETPRNTWLEEDDDVWGADGGGTPGILR
ncbi:pentapeptide repeat-containing protein [Micromonospora sp. NPDC048170]|uniref:pentapeptide repeat-containing protein n=1 Tax=Micromonospora sp. NPDC048170 TaxID=3154819 RepID=UPI0034114590